jgi:hypothetical protein
MVEASQSLLSILEASGQKIKAQRLFLERASIADQGAVRIGSM